MSLSSVIPQIRIFALTRQWMIVWLKGYMPLSMGMLYGVFILEELHA
jgi:hypothetical protein